MKRCETQNATKHDLDNRSRQLNPQDKVYWQSRGAEMGASAPASPVHDRPRTEGIKPD